MIKGVRHGYHDHVTPDPDPVDQDGKLLLAMCLLQQAGLTDLIAAVPDDQELVLEEFQYNRLGIYIKINGREAFLRAKDMVSEENLFDE